MNSVDIFWFWLRQGWCFRGAKGKKYADRVKYEASIIIQKDLVDYFLVVSDVVRYAKDNGIPIGPARGSAAASLVCYFLRITEIDPMKFPTMVFERFLNPSRSDLPDIDLDIADDCRNQIRKYLCDKYGAEKVGNVGNFIRYKGKSSINDVARVYQIPRWVSEEINSSILERADGDPRLSKSIEDTVALFPKIKEVFDEHSELYLASNLEGNYRGMSVHAAGLVVSNGPITDTCATYTRIVGGEEKTIIAYDKKDAEYCGMLKIDFLGLKTMGMIKLCLEQIGMSLNELYSIPLDDADTLSGFKSNDLVGIFQFEGRTARLINSDVRPDNFLHLADVNALARPGPLMSGMTQQYIDVKQGKKRKKKVHPIVDEITKWTYGQVIYEEQVLKIIAELGGFNSLRIGDIRSAVKLKLGQVYMQSIREEFQQGAKDLHGVNRSLSEKIWNGLVSCSMYLFNIAHSASYAMLSFWCMYLKIKYPLEFYSASLIKLEGNKNDREYKLPRLLHDARRRGIAINPPHHSRSGLTWSADRGGQAVIAGFGEIPGIGLAKATAIIEHRKSLGACAFNSWSDVLGCPGVGVETIKKMITFSCGEDPFDLDRASKTLGEVRKQFPVISHSSDDLIGYSGYVTIALIVRAVLIGSHIEFIRSRTGQSEKEILEEMKDPHLVHACLLKCYDDGAEDVHVRVNRWRYPEFKELISGIEPGLSVIIVSGVKREGFGLTVGATGLSVLEV